MNHWLIAPILIPMICLVLSLATTHSGIRFTRGLCLAGTTILVPVAIYLLTLSMDGNYHTYLLGNWPVPVGIVLVVDRLSAFMLLLTAVLALFSLVYAIAGSDEERKDFHLLFQAQLMGLNGAFLAGDLFNLFVFFEILLLASYGLLLHGGGSQRSRAGLHYVVLNLIGSSIFLIALGLIYGVAGTLNLADLASRVTTASAEQLPLLRSAALLLLVVFGLKAALMPFYFWLPSSYSAAKAPVAALFAIMTKLGVYGILRVYSVVFGPPSGTELDITGPWLIPLALITLVIGALGAMASNRLRVLVAYLVVASVGLLLTMVGVFTKASIAAGLYYLLHSTLITGGFFLLADLLAQNRGNISDRLTPGPSFSSTISLRALFVIAAISIAGMPPLSGFVGKLMSLIATSEHEYEVWIWSIILVTSFIIILTLSRAASILFWKTDTSIAQTIRVPWLPTSAAAVLIFSSLLLSVYAGPVYDLMVAIANQLLIPDGYINGVSGALSSLMTGGEIR